MKEYKIVFIHSKCNIDNELIKKLGQEGWEVDSMFSNWEQQGKNIKVFLMREIKNDKQKINEIALEVQRDFQMGGLADGIYLDFATEVAIRYANIILKK